MKYLKKIVWVIECIAIGIAFCGLLYFCTPPKYDPPTPPYIGGCWFTDTQPQKLFIFDPGSAIHCRTDDPNRLDYDCSYIFEQSGDTVFICPTKNDVDETWLVTQLGTEILDIRIFDCRMCPTIHMTLIR